MPTQPVREQSAPAPMLRPLIAFLRAHPPFSRMAAAHLDFLAKRLQPIYYARGDHFERSAELCIVRTGRIRVRDAEKSLREALPGDTVFSPQASSKTERRLSGEAVEDSFCLELDHDGADTLAKLSREFQAFRRHEGQDA